MFKLIIFASIVFSLTPAARARSIVDSFDPYANDTVFSIAIQPDGKILIGGDFTTLSPDNGATVVRNRIGRLNTDGSVDLSFNPNANGQVNSIVVQPDGKILLGGFFTTLSPNGGGAVTHNRIARLNNDGTLDPTFSPSFNLQVLSIALQPNGEILIGGIFTTFTPNGGITVARNRIVRLNPDGTLDTTFDPNSNGDIYAIALQPDGKILVGGFFLSVSPNGGATVPRNRMARLNGDGSLDEGFDPNANSAVLSIAMQPDGRILLGGGFSTLSPNGGPTVSRNRIARINQNGTLDTSFDPNANNAIDSIVVQADGKILLGGNFTALSPNGGELVLRARIARLNMDGTLDWDLSFDANDGVESIAVQADRKIIVGGFFTAVTSHGGSGVIRNRIARLEQFGSAAIDYDGDGKSDISVFRPSNGGWYLQQSQAGFAGVAFGNSTDKIVPADYDGDGKTDIAVYRPSEGVWYILNSSNGAFSYSIFGTAEDLPAPADYDGDGKADVCVFRPSSGSWYRLNSSNGAFVAVQFGQSGDKPTIGDFDGDGKADIAVYRPSIGSWYRLNSSNGAFVPEQFGISTDLIAPADYDGDGKTDLAVFRPSSGYWYVKYSSNGAFVPTNFGSNGDIPAPGDFDGDGKADVAVFRPSDGSWYRLNSLNGAFVATQFGTNGDLPTPAAFR